jgi:hypothetical protein
LTGGFFEMTSRASFPGQTMRIRARKRIATKAGKALRERAAKERKRRKIETLTASPIWKNLSSRSWYDER